MAFVRPGTASQVGSLKRTPHCDDGCTASVMPVLIASVTRKCGWSDDAQTHSRSGCFSKWICGFILIWLLRWTFTALSF